MGKFFLEKNFIPVVYIQNDQVCMLGYPPPPPGAWRLTARLANPQGLGQPRPPPPPLTSPRTVAQTTA